MTRSYGDALTDQRIAERGGRPYPERITMALDAPAGGGRPLEGPDVDAACDATEPAVDRWETGEEVPTPHQLELLAALTGYPIVPSVRQLLAVGRATPAKFGSPQCPPPPASPSPPSAASGCG